MKRQIFRIKFNIFASHTNNAKNWVYSSTLSHQNDSRSSTLPSEYNGAHYRNYLLPCLYKYNSSDDDYIFTFQEMETNVHSVSCLKWEINELQYGTLIYWMLRYVYRIFVVVECGAFYLNQFLDAACLFLFTRHTQIILLMHWLYMMVNSNALTAGVSYP